MNLPGISVIMPALNSAKTIEKSLRSVRNQDYPQDKIEVLVLDGGSKDKTLSIAKKYKSTIVNNPEVLPEAAKSLGLRKATGRYAVFLDSDEEIKNLKSFREKVGYMKKYPKCKNITTTGLVRPKEFPFITEYINRYGEPFSYFLYRVDGGNYFGSLGEKYNLESKSENYEIVKFEPGQITPIVDGGGHFFDLSYLKSITDTGDKQLSAKVFSTMCSKTHRLGVLKNDYVVHHSKPSLKSYLGKIHWRIVSNLSNTNSTPGYKNRESFYSKNLKRKKFLFLPYAFSVVFPLIDSIILIIRHRDPRFIIHLPLSLFTALDILFQVIKIKLLGLPVIVGEYK